MEPQKDDQLGPWLALFCVPKLSLRCSLALLKNFKTPAAVLSANSSKLKECGVSPEARKAIHEYQNQCAANIIAQRVSQSLNWCQQAEDHHIIHFEHDDYPVALKEIAQPPLLLFVMGEPGLLNRPQLAMVGSRSPSFDGKQLAKNFAAEIGHLGLMVTSGLAIGIDGESHRGALDAGFPTVAVMATGIDQIYPKQHVALAQQIRQRGALVTEFPLGQGPRAHSFPQRNRIISGLSLGVLVVEAAIKSGSLITARYALEQNREVFAIPGSIHNPLARGCHRLIRDGAKLVECGQDISDELSLQLTLPLENVADPVAEQSYPEGAVYRQVLEKMGFDPVPMDALVERTELMVTELSAVLTQLTLQGKVEHTERGFVRVFTPEANC